jgi:hypothetical protein
MDQLDGNEPKDFQYSVPNQPQYLYEKEIPENAGKRARAIGAVTTTILVAGGLVGGAAFAMGSLGNNTTPSSATVSTTTIQPTSTAATATSATPDSTPTATSTPRTIAVPPAPFSDEEGKRKFSKPSGSTGTVSTAAPSGSPAPVVTGAPSFGGSGDGEDRHHDGEFRQPRPVRTAGSFSNDD